MGEIWSSDINQNERGGVISIGGERVYPCKHLTNTRYTKKINFKSHLVLHIIDYIILKDREARAWLLDHFGALFLKTLQSWRSMTWDEGKGRRGLCYGEAVFFPSPSLLPQWMHQMIVYGKVGTRAEPKCLVRLTTWIPCESNPCPAWRTNMKSIGHVDEWIILLNPHVGNLCYKSPPKL